MRGRLSCLVMQPTPRVGSWSLEAPECGVTVFGGQARATRRRANVINLRSLGERSPYPSGPEVKVSG